MVCKRAAPPRMEWSDEGGQCPRLVIAGTGSGVGKTSLALGLARRLARQGLRVQTFKVGPDFLDPTYLAIASGRTCYNLDGWMTSREYVCELFAGAAAHADIAIIEGVMGLFDGASLDKPWKEVRPRSPVGLVRRCCWWSTRMARPAALRRRSRVLHDSSRACAVAGMIANQGGSQRHRDCVSEALAAAGGPPLMGMLPRGSLPALGQPAPGIGDRRASGPVGRNPRCSWPMRAVDAWTCLRSWNWRDAVKGECVRRTPRVARRRTARVPVVVCRGLEVRLGIARDEAFHFYYPDNLEALTRAGVQWAPFSPLADACLPADVAGLYFGGGYPEVHAARLSENKKMLAAVHDFAVAGGLVYAECGGLMYLGRELVALDGERYPMASLLPIETAMLEKLHVLGYAEVEWAADSLWGGGREIGRGHEFHYSHITAQDVEAEGWQPACTVCRRRSEPALEGFRRGRILASYVHLHWASRPQAINHFLSCCEQRP